MVLWEKFTSKSGVCRFFSGAVQVLVSAEMFLFVSFISMFVLLILLNYLCVIQMFANSVL